MRVLVVENDPATVARVRAALESAGHQVTVTSSGTKAVEILSRQPHPVVIADAEIPGMTGVELCDTIRAGDGESDGYTYTILLTNDADVQGEQRVHTMSAGADDFIAKSFKPQELLAHMHSAEEIVSLENRDVAIFAMAKMAESRDPDTGRHLERVMNYSRVLATQLQTEHYFTEEIDNEFIRDIYATSPLHDIGKVGIPDCVLLKPGRLTESEFEVMKGHAVIGATTLEATLGRFPGIKFLKMAGDIALYHHEHWDGKGYPLGVAGLAIPLAARVVAVADVYDALTSKRVYKDAMPHEMARAMILKESGTHFDPLIVNAFVAAEPTFISIQNRLCEPQRVAA